MASNKPFTFPKFKVNKNTCKHPAKAQIKKVIRGLLCCETTVIQCSDCGEHLTPQETNC